MKMKIEIGYEYNVLNTYSVIGEHGSFMTRTGFKHGFSKKRWYDVTGSVNGHFIAVKFDNYRSARQLFDAMEDR